MARKPQPGDPDFDWSQYAKFKQENDPLAEAQESLTRADQLSTDANTDGLLSIPERLAAITTKPDTRGKLRKTTEALSTGGNIALGASLPAMINPAIGGALATGGGLATVPDYLRRMIAPDEDEERPGVMETGIQGLSLLPAVSSLKGLRNAARMEKAAAGAKWHGPRRDPSLTTAAKHTTPGADVRANFPYEPAVRGKAGNVIQEGRNSPLSGLGKAVEAPSSRYYAQDVLEQPGSQRFMQEGAKKHGPTVRASQEASDAVESERLMGALRKHQAAGDATFEAQLIGPEVDLTDETLLSPLDRLSRLSRARSKARGFGSNSALAEGY
jgi:hypothetical protein